MTHISTGIEYLIIDDEEGNFCVEVPSLPGCFTFGSTVDEAIARASEAILGYLEAQKVIRAQRLQSQQMNFSEINLAIGPTDVFSSGTYVEHPRGEVWAAPV